MRSKIIVVICFIAVVLVTFNVTRCDNQSLSDNSISSDLTIRCEISSPIGLRALIRAFKSKSKAPVVLALDLVQGNPRVKRIHRYLINKDEITELDLGEITLSKNDELIIYEKISGGKELAAFAPLSTMKVVYKDGHNKTSTAHSFEYEFPYDENFGDYLKASELPKDNYWNIVLILNKSQPEIVFPNTRCWATNR